jgi:hypothetical protein
MKDYSLRWSQIPRRDRPEPYDWAFILKECAILAGILVSAAIGWWMIVALN